MSGNLWSFYKTLIKNPREVGAALPSSKALANTIASYVPLEKNSLVIELGPGTGVITKAILSHGISSENLMLIEQSPFLAQSLSDQFPMIKVIHGNASHLDSLLTHLNKPISAIASSLPFLSLPSDTAKIILKHIETLLCDKGYFIQYTYGNHDPWAVHFSKMEKVDNKKVWRNFPPARVFVYKKKTF